MSQIAKDLEPLITEYLGTLSKAYLDSEEQFATPHQYATWELTAFFEWLEKRES